MESQDRERVEKRGNDAKAFILYSEKMLLV